MDKYVFNKIFKKLIKKIRRIKINITNLSNPIFFFFRIYFRTDINLCRFKSVSVLVQLEEKTESEKI